MHRHVHPLDVLTLGEPLGLFIACEPGPLEQVTHFRRATAGAEFNVAIGLARLGLRTALLSRLGDDALGRHLRTVMRREGVVDQHVKVDPEHLTGFMFKALAAAGVDPAIEYHRRGSAASHFGPDDLPADLLTRTRHVHLSGVAPAVSPRLRAAVFALARAARAQGCSLSFDPNLRPSLWSSHEAMIETLRELASLCDWVLPGRSEGEALTGQREPEAIAETFVGWGARRVVVKDAQGAYHLDTGTGWRGWVPARPVARIVDTVGAGDGFAVGVISALLEGQDLAEATARGHAIGARVLGFPGDADGLPTRHELQADLAAANATLGATT